MRLHLRGAAIAGALLLAIGGGFLALRPEPVPVETEQVMRGRFEVVVEEDGRTRVRDRYVISAPVAGRVLRAGLRAGDTVERGDLVALILAAPSALLSPRARREAEERVGVAEAMSQQADILVQRAAALLVQAAADAARLRELHARGAAPLQQLERAELAERTALDDLLAAERRRHAAQHELDEARAMLAGAEASDGGPERHEIRAPIVGRVLRILQESEAIVASGTPLLELGDPADLDVVVDVLTTEAVGIMPGTPVVIERWGGRTALPGRVRLVEPGAFTRVSALGVEEQRVAVVIDFVGPREDRATLGDGFRVEARITVEVTEDAVLVPVSALFRRGSGWSAFVLEAGVARERPVEVLRRSARSAIVSRGIVVGETAIVFPPSTLRDGARVRAVR
ncbi:MAG: efflux RND transporter periplasmic adaptor subunit [Acetobacteraceae bacterium]|jgi:HlyD family secretion protein